MLAFMAHLRHLWRAVAVSASMCISRRLLAPTGVLARFTYLRLLLGRILLRRHLLAAVCVLRRRAATGRLVVYCAVLCCFGNAYVCASERRHNKFEAA